MIGWAPTSITLFLWQFEDFSIVRKNQAGHGAFAAGSPCRCEPTHLQHSPMGCCTQWISRSGSTAIGGAFCPQQKSLHLCRGHTKNLWIFGFYLKKTVCVDMFRSLDLCISVTYRYRPFCSCMNGRKYVGNLVFYLPLYFSSWPLLVGAHFVDGSFTTSSWVRLLKL